MKPEQAKNVTLMLGLASLVPAIFMSGVLGNSRPEGGSGFWVFFGYIVPLLAGFVLVNHFAPTSARLRMFLKKVVFTLLMVYAIGDMFFNRHLVSALDPLFGIIGEHISYAWYLGPIVLLLNALCSNAK